MHFLKNMLFMLVTMLMTLVSFGAHATEEGIDVSAVTDAISGHGTILVAIGAAVLGVLYLARVFSWGRKI